MAVAIYSAITGMPISSDIAMTGEISIRGKVKPVGGVVAKVEAAKTAGIKKVLIPAENWQELFKDIGIDVIPVEDINQVMEIVFHKKQEPVKEVPIQQNQTVNVLTASGT
jgi:Lon-like ATP-dependent protease